MEIKDGLVFALKLQVAASKLKQLNDKVPVKFIHRFGNRRYILEGTLSWKPVNTEGF